MTQATQRERKSHIWEKEANEHYVEPAWCSARLFEEEPFVGPVHDPACGFGTIVDQAHIHGIVATGADLVDRGYADGNVRNYLADSNRYANIVTNPPFGRAAEFLRHGLRSTLRKIAFVFPIARVNAAWSWADDAPLRRIWLLTPRPSMPPGHVIAAGEKPQGGRVDYCWLVWEQGYLGWPEWRWLHRDRANVFRADEESRAAA